MMRGMKGRGLRFVHCADVHLDTPYRSRSESLRRRLAESGSAAWRAVCELCREVEAQLLIVAGDLYDDERLSLATERRLVADLERLTANGVHVVIATGNHDPGGGARARRIAWPRERCHVLRGPQVERIELCAADGEPFAIVVGAGHASAREERNLARDFPVADGALPAVAVLHTQVHDALGAGRHEPYAPAARADLARGYDYWALGHVHRRQKVADDPPAWYPGNLHGRHFQETGAKGALVVDISRGRAPQVSFRPLAGVRFEELRIDVTGVADAGALAHRVRAAFDATRAKRDVLPHQDWLLRLALVGETPLAPELAGAERRRELAESFAAELDVLDCELVDAGVARPLALETQRGQPHTLGLALDLCSELGSDDGLWSRLAGRVFAGLAPAERRARATRLRARLAANPERFERLVAEALCGEDARLDGGRPAADDAPRGAELEA